MASLEASLVCCFMFVVELAVGTPTEGVDELDVVGPLLRNENLLDALHEPRPVTQVDTSPARRRMPYPVFEFDGHVPALRSALDRPVPATRRRRAPH